jgi:hypothetical protein
VDTQADPAVEQVRQLQQLRGIGPESAWLYVREFFGWRHFRNRREVGALAGLPPTPWQSGDTTREQGIRKAGNRYVRGLAIEIAWGWLHYQPTSARSQWYRCRFSRGGPRAQDRDCGLGAQTLDRPVALSGNGGGPRRCGVESSEGVSSVPGSGNLIAACPRPPPGTAEGPLVRWGRR